MTSVAEQNVPVRFGALPAVRADVLQRALARACNAGAAAALVAQPAADQVLNDSDVIVVLAWPPTEGAQPAARAAMAARKPVIVLETTFSADWPALDPQTWQPRGFGTEAPIVVSLDPRDEEHSLVLAIQRLAADSALRTRLADAAHAWVASHA